MKQKLCDKKKIIENFRILCILKVKNEEKYFYKREILWKDS